ncbi:MAG TPA: hypothetical protein VNA69_01170 [Thermoanaerobaculia bacterium]|nr:hypothetical protein [Thermoanaerobaculia bacterium]
MATLAGLFFFIGAVFVLGFALTRELLARAGSRASSPERVVYSLLLSVALWLVIAWALALAGRLTRAPLLAAGVVALIAGIVLLAGQRGERRERTAYDWRAILVLTPLAGFTLFLLWRGVVAPPHTPDALTYHMPRAAMIARAAHFEYFTETRDHRANLYPANYELLVATMLVLDGHDRLTEWLSTLFFVVFLLEAGALSRQWWGRGTHNVAVVLGAATMPVLLLQGAAHKNDLMMNVFVVGAVLALGRWLDDGDRLAALLLGVCTAAAIGTKPHGLALAALAFLPFAAGAVRHVRRGAMRPAHLVALACIVLTLLPLLGACAYFIKEPASQQTAAAPASVAERVVPVMYGEWSYLLVAPALMFLAPFSGSDTVVRLPWNGEEWLWERYDPYASSFGGGLSVLVLAFPFVLWRFRSAEGELTPMARGLVTSVAVALFLIALPVRAHIYGYISGYPRYLLFITPLVLAWVIGAPLREVMRQRSERLVWIGIAVFALLVTQTLVHIARRDKFARLHDLRWAAAHAGTRRMPSMPRTATTIVDELAAEDAAIDVHGAVDTWIYPAFGETLRRDLHYIEDAREIRPEAEWVIVERAYSAIWPAFRHIRDWENYLGKGHAAAADLKVIRQLDADPRFERVFLHERTAQAVYRRKPRTIRQTVR